MTAVLEASRLGKRYRVRKEQSVVLGLVRRQAPRSWWALRDASFAVAPGEVLAVIGRNGAGKSTLLKIAAGVTHPTTGHLVRPRRIAPLIEVGAGFHPEMTGRENVMINGRILGLSPTEVRARFDDIVEFAELGHAIDQQIREYSSGMFVRLGFAVAVHTYPALLVVDEVLAVGDLPFQARCLDRIQQMRDEGVGVLFVSHNLAAVQNIADRGLLLERGETLAQGPVAEVIGAYHDLLDRTGREREGVHEEAGSTGELELVDLRAVDSSGQHRLTWEPGEPAALEARVRATRDVPAGAIAGFNLAKEGAGLVAHWMGRDPEFHLPALGAGDELTLRFDVRLNVGEGGYWLSLSIARPDWSALMLAHRDALRLGVTARGAAGGIVDLDTEFSVVGGD